MWCYQVVRLLSNTLLQLVDKNSRQLTTSLDSRMEIFRRNLLSPLPGYFHLTDDIESTSQLLLAPKQESLRAILTSPRNSQTISTQQTFLEKIKHKVIAIPLIER